MALWKVIHRLDDHNKLYTMKNVSHKRVWGADTNPAHVDPPIIPLVKEMSTGKSDGDDDKLKLHRGPVSSK